MQIISPPSFCFLASISVITPLGVDIIAIPRPLFIFGKLCALENILLPGFEILSIVIITGDPWLYFRFINKLKEFDFILSTL